MTSNLEKNILQHSIEMAAKVHEEAELAQSSEEDIRIVCIEMINRFIQESDIELVKGRHEYRAGKGRIDSKYGHLIIEFKNPQGGKSITSNKNSAGAREVRNQIRSRFTALHTEEKVQMTRMLGVALDGRHIMYVQHDGKKFLESFPQTVNRRSLERLFRALVSIGARGISYTPSNLARHFAASSSCARSCVKIFYELIASERKDKAEMMYQQWETMFGEVCGLDITKHKVDVLAKQFQLKDCDARRLLFAIHTYYSVFMKLLSAQILVAMSAWMTSPIQQILNSESPSHCRMVLSEIEKGGIWAQIGIRNFLEGDLFSWYTEVWDDQCDLALRTMASTLTQFDPQTLSVEPQESRDLLKQLYQELVPRVIRHDLGEYYTPDWLAELIFSEVGYTGDPDRRVLDPACGSGTFLVLAIGKVREWFAENRTTCGFDERELVRKILDNIIGFDLNPLAVMAARTNYLIAIRDLIGDIHEVDLPVHLCDSLLSRGNLSNELPHEQVLTAVGTFTIPEEVTHTAGELSKYARSLEHCVDNEYLFDEFLTYCEDRQLPTVNLHAHKTLYRKLVSLKIKKQNGIWARIIKNAFAPLFVGHVDFVIGNPPWVNWEHLPKDYRSATTSLWVRYGLFNLKDGQHRLGGSKKDLSMLFTYFCLDQYLENGGRLGFVITNSVFKSKHAGSGFRRFRYAHGDNDIIYLNVEKIHDFSRKTVFDGVANETAVLLCKRSTEPHQWPVSCVEWFGNPKKIPEFLDYDEIKAKFNHTTRMVHPVDRSVRTSPWLTAHPSSLRGLLKIQGTSDYSFKVGVNTMGLISVYWVEILSRTPNGNLLVRNLYDEGKVQVAPVTKEIEPELVYPLIRSRDIKKYSATPSVAILLVQDPKTRSGIPEPVMRQRFPKAFAYFKIFEGHVNGKERGTLRARAGYRKYFEPTDPFYSMYNVGPYSIANIKVLCRQFVPDLTMAVAQPSELPYFGTKVPLTQHCVSFCEVQQSFEGYYLAALGNSSPARLLHMRSSTGKSYGQPSVLQSIRFPLFDPKNSKHKEIAKLSELWHLEEPDAESPRRTEIDRLAAAIWELSESDLTAIVSEIRELTNR